MQGLADNTQHNKERQDWMKILACADWADLTELAAGVSLSDHFSILRQPETGLIMVRARMGGSGQPFNTGEATVTRCTVRDDSGMTGHAYIMGRNADHALCAARIDAALQEPTKRQHLLEQIIEPLKNRAEARRLAHQKKTAATKVDFFTLVRGEDD